MTKSIVVTLLMLLLPQPSLQAAKLKKLLVVSEVALCAATFADWQSSRGLRELNPILGQSRVRQATIMGGSTAGIILLERFCLRKKRKAAIIVNLVGVGVHLGMAVHNWRVR